MSCVNQNFTMFEGESKRLLVQVLDRDGNPFDLSGVSRIRWEMQRDLALNGADLVKELGEGITVTDPQEGRFRIDLVPTDTLGLHGRYYHEARLTDSLGHVATVLTGRVHITKTAID